MNEQVDGLVDPAFAIQQLPRVPLTFASSVVNYHKPRARHGDRKALQVALAVAATSDRGFGKWVISLGMGSTLEVQRCSFWFLCCPHGLLDMVLIDTVFFLLLPCSRPFPLQSR